MRVELRCPAKINLWLKVLGRRSDGYHEVETVLHTVDLCDALSLAEHRKALRFKCSVPSLEGSANLVCRAVGLLQAAAKRCQGLEVFLHKRIPVAGGLGGGSSDAAGLLRGLNQFWSLGFAVKDIQELGAGLGSDVPFFVRGGCALARGRGEKVSFLPHLRSAWVVIVNPLFSLSTSRVYSWFEPGLTRKPTLSTMVFEIFERGDLHEIASHFANDLEQALLLRYPLLQELKTELLRAGAVGALVAGSGPSVFGLCASRGAAQDVARSVSGPDRAVFVCRTVGPVEHSGVVQPAGQQPLEL